MAALLFYLFFFFFNDTPPPEIYTLPLHDALPIYRGHGHLDQHQRDGIEPGPGMKALGGQDRGDVTAERVEPLARDRELPGHERQVEREGQDRGEEIGRAHV